MRPFEMADGRDGRLRRRVAVEGYGVRTSLVARRMRVGEVAGVARRSGAPVVAGS